MKKRYIKPITNQYIIKCKQTLLNASATFSKSLGSNNIDGIDGDKVLSREGFWEDEE